MKVLVTNGSNGITWYEGMEDKVFPVDKIKDDHYLIPDEFAPVQERKYGPCGIHLPDGELLYTEQEYNEINQELLQRREEVAELTNDREKLNKEILALQESLEMVRNDRQKILRRMEQDAKQEKVVLPREVADAIEYCREGITDVGIVKWIANKNYESRLGPAIDWIYDDNDITTERQDLLLKALVNGYTVEPEQTPKERAIQHCIKHGLVARGKSEHDVVTAIMSILQQN